jgi:CheY-like chemotaxis protein
MLWKNRNARLVGTASPSDRPQRSDVVVEIRQDGGTIAFTAADKRLLRVLVADDYKDAADSLSMLVKIWGHDVRVAYDGAQALEMTLVHQPDVLLLDMGMPKIDGCELTQELRRQDRFKDTLLIALTGYADAAHRLLCAKAGFDLCLVKPVEPSTLETLLLLEQHRLTFAGEPRCLVPNAPLGAVPRSNGQAHARVGTAPPPHLPERRAEACGK